MFAEEFREIGEFGAAGMYEEEERSLFYRNALGIRRYYEHCALPEWHGEALYPSGVLPNEMLVRPRYYKGMEADHEALKQKNPILSGRFAEDFDQYRTSVPWEHSVAGNMYTHCLPNYERILKEGFLSYLPRIQKIQDRDFREGLVHVVEGIRCYSARCAEYLESVGAGKELIAAIRKVPLFPAENFFEAVLSWNFVLYLDQCDNLGCLAEGLLPYWNGEDGSELLKNLYDNLDQNGGYSMALGTRTNPLTLMCLEASKGKRRPMIELFVDEKTPDEVWKKAFEVIRTKNGQPAFYNGALFPQAFIERFPEISEEDIRKLCGVGCTEMSIAGLTHAGSLDAGMNLPLILERTIRDRLCDCADFEEFYRVYLEYVRRNVTHVLEEIRNSQRMRVHYSPLPMRTLLVDDCIDRGREFNADGARYQWSIVNFAGLINVIDAMLVIREAVYREKRYTAEELVSALAADDETVLSELRKYPISFGTDEDAVNAFSKRISGDIFSFLDGEKPAFGMGFLPASIQFMSQVSAGKNVGATPDGRRSGAPLCDSLAAIFGKDIKGPTALLKSVAALEQKKAIGTPVLNFNVEEDFDPRVLKALILGYFQAGGLQMQISCTSEENLLDAYAHPENHRNLVVRVGGYSEYFNALDDELKRMVINRSIQKL